jgi:hypothetical protein
MVPPLDGVRWRKRSEERTNTETGQGDLIRLASPSLTFS